MHRTDPRLLAVARGDEPADLVLRDARIVNVFTRSVERGSVALCDGRIARIGDALDAACIVDLGGAFVAPGFIDAHMHVESTMLLPAQFARVAVPHGTTGVILDPHEIANVLGLDGIRFLMSGSPRLPMNVFFAASSCVPASPLETAGAEISTRDLATLFEDPRVVALAEMMNFPGVIHAVPEVLEKVRLGLDERLVDGHAPGLSGPALQAYVAAGISSDHESTQLEEAREKLALGMRIYLREGSAARNLEALLPLVTPANAHRCCFCTDDRHPGDLLDDGHIDHVVRRAIALGLDPATAIAMGSLHTAEHYGLRDLGAVAPGFHADLVVFDDLSAPRPRDVYFHGALVAEGGRGTVEITGSEVDDGFARDTVRLHDDFGAPDLRAEAPPAGTPIRVIGMDPHQLVTRDLRMTPRVAADEVVADVERDVLKLAVIERHRGTGNVGVGFVHGFGLRDGALASTVGHDSHNVIVVGTNDRDMVAAARALAACGGGQCAVRDGVVIALLPLPIAGLLSDEPAETIIAQQRRLLEATRTLGCPHEDPFMPLSFLPLTVIPELKLSDRGLVDVNAFRIVGLGVEELDG
jgi:adenine deaminase